MKPKEFIKYLDDNAKKKPEPKAKKIKIDRKIKPKPVKD